MFRGSRGLQGLRDMDRFKQAFIALLVLAFVVRAGYVLDNWRFIPINDSRNYDWLGKGLANGKGWAMGSSAYRPPGYPFFLAAVYSIIGDPQTKFNHVIGHDGWTGLRIVEAVLATGTVGLTGWLALQLTGRRVALVVMLVAAVYLPYVLVGVSMMTECLLVPLELLAVNFAVRSRRTETGKTGRRWIVLAGFFAGLAALTRGNGVVIGFALAFVVWSAVPRWSWRSLAQPALLLAVMVLTISPWTIRNYIAQHAFIPVTTELGATLAGTYNSVAAKHDYVWESGHRYHDYYYLRHKNKLPEHVRDARLTSDVIKYIEHHPQAVPLTMFWNTVRLFDLDGRHVGEVTARTDTGADKSTADLAMDCFYIVGILAIIGLMSPLTRRIPRVLWLVPLFIWLSEAPITTGTPRFRAALDPWFILLAGNGVALLASRVRSFSPVRRRLVSSGPAQGMA